MKHGYNFIEVIICILVTVFCFYNFTDIFQKSKQK